MAAVFRKSAMDKIASPDQLDRMIRITTPMSWIGVLAAVLLAVSVIVWSLKGTIPTTIMAQGFFSGAYNTNTLFSTASGTVSQILTEPGSRVAVGTPVLEIRSGTGEIVTMYSSQTGVVSDVFVRPGNTVTSNAEVLRLSPDTDQDLAVICYVDLQTAALLKSGMKAIVFSDGADASASGHMEAVVSNVDSYVSSENAICEVLGADGQMAHLLMQNGPVVAVTCILLADDFTFQNGSQASIQLILDESAPISKVFPMLGGV